MQNVTKRWTIKPAPSLKNAELLASELGVTPLIAGLLVQRGVQTFDDAKHFFRPSLNDLHDPFLMKDMDKAVGRLIKAIREKEKIMVFGDYDVDGTTAVALVYSFLKIRHPDTVFYIPDRYAEGYGISILGIDHANATGISLIIALDCGIKANEKVDYANSLGIDLIICDHHRPGEKLPEAFAVLDPKRDDCSYPYKELSGCGIGFKLVQAFAKRSNIPFEELEQFLDLVVVSIGSDIVPITGENRVLAHFGLRMINASPRTGFKALLELASVKKQLTINELVFIIGPRINAAGRIESGSKAVELLIAGDMDIAREVSNIINKNNQDRRELDVNITQEALAMIAGNAKMLSRKSTVLFHAEWHKGVVGIVASRLIERYYRPTIVLTQSGESLSGSARSVKGFDVYEAIDKCSDLLEQFGGHMYAAGLSLKAENFEAFSDRFEEVVSASITDEMLVPEIDVDAGISLDEIDHKLLNILGQFQPFGPGNMAPVFLSKNLTDTGYARVVGKDHLKLEVVQTSPKFHSFQAIGFGLGGKLKDVEKEQPFDIAYTIEENEWQGRKSIQLNVKDIKRGGGPENRE